MIRKYIRFYLAIIKFNINLKLVYRANFWVNLFNDLIYYVIHILTFAAIFSNVESVNGWNMYQVIFFLGTFTIIDSLAMTTYFFGVIGISDSIRTGSLDLYITKPINTLFYVSMKQFEFSTIFNTIFGIIVLVYGWTHINMDITVSRVLGYIAVVLLMYTLNFTLMMIPTTAAFWFIRTDALGAFSQEMFNFAYRVPGVAYKGIWRVIFFILIPYGLLATVPTQFATGTIGISELAVVLGVCAVFWALCIYLWKKGLKRYNSASS